MKRSTEAVNKKTDAVNEHTNWLYGRSVTKVADSQYNQGNTEQPFHPCGH